MAKSRRARDPDRLTAAVRALLPLRSRARRARGARVADPAARLRLLERDLQEVRTRVNALFFAVFAVALGDLVTRLLSS